MWEPWDPITVDIKHKSHEYRVFVIRKEGPQDVARFQDMMQKNANAFLLNRDGCPNITEQPLEYHDISPWWNENRLIITPFAIATPMLLFILISRCRYNLKLKKRAEEYQKKKKRKNNEEKKEEEEQLFDD